MPPETVATPALLGPWGRVERPDGDHPGEWRRWLQAARAVAGVRPSVFGDTIDRETGFALPAEPPALTSVHTVGTSRQVLATIKDSNVSRIAYVERFAELSTAWRELQASKHDARAKNAKSRVSRTWHKQRARGLRTRWIAVAQCETRIALKTRCGGCGAHESTPLRCGLPRECPTCRGRELGTRKERIRGLIARAEALRPRERSRKRPTKSRPLGRWSWKFLTLTMPPGAGVVRDGKQVRKAFGVFTRKIAAFLKIDGKETGKAALLSSVEVTVSISKTGHVHLHVLALLPFVHHALLRRWWGDAVASGREMPSKPAGEVLALLEGDRLAELAVMSRRGRHGRMLDAVRWPVIDVRSSDGESSVNELAKYVMKGNDLENSLDSGSAVDCLAALHGVRLFASSRWCAVPKESAIAFRECSCCGMLGEFTCTVSPSRGPPEGSKVVLVDGCVGDTPRPRMVITPSVRRMLAD